MSRLQGPRRAEESCGTEQKFLGHGSHRESWSGAAFTRKRNKCLATNAAGAMYNYVLSPSEKERRTYRLRLEYSL